MKKTSKYFLIMCGTASLIPFCLGAAGNFSGLMNVVLPFINDPVNAFLYITGFVGVVSFLVKFLRDVCHWFSTGLGTKATEGRSTL